MKEVSDILSYNYKHIEFIDKKVDLGFDCPLDLHCDYTTDVIMAAFGYFNEEKKTFHHLHSMKIMQLMKSYFTGKLKVKHQYKVQQYKDISII